MENYRSFEPKNDGLELHRKIQEIIMDIEGITIKLREKKSTEQEEYNELKKQLAEKSAEFNALKKKLKEIERGVMDKNDNGIVGYA